MSKHSHYHIYMQLHKKPDYYFVFFLGKLANVLLGAFFKALIHVLPCTPPPVLKNAITSSL